MNNKINKYIAIDVREASGQPAGMGRIVTSIIKAIQLIDPKRKFVLLGSNEITPENLTGTFIKVGEANFLWHIKCAKLINENPNWESYISIRSPLTPIMAPDKSIYFVNDLISFKYPEYFTLKTRLIELLFIKIALRRVKNIVAISHSTAKDIQKLVPSSKERITVIPLAADPVFATKPPDFGVLNKYNLIKSYILIVATIEPRKNHLSLLRAYNDMPSDIKNKYNLVVVGKRGWHCDKITKVIKENVISGSIKYLEYISDSDLVHIYNGASLFVYPSFYEGFGIPVVEAMSCGVPVITSNISSLPEVGGKAAYYIDPYKCEDISGAMVEVLTNKALRRKMISMGLEQSKIYSWEETALKLLNIISDI